MQRRALSREERQLVLFTWNSRTADYRAERCLHHLVELQAAQRPGAPAVRCAAEGLTYGQLNRRANQLARYLAHRAGVRPGVLVALCVHRSLDMVVAILGILKAGGAFLPISPTYPRERVAFLLKDSAAPVLLTQQQHRDGLPEFGGLTLSLEEIGARLDLEDPGNPEVAVAATDLAYVIYTSGSTGTPKGVLLEHRGTYNTAAAHIELCGVRPDDRLLQFAAFGFDGAIIESLMALGAGAELILVPQDELLLGEPLARLLEDSAITMATLQPSVMATLPARPLPRLRTLISAGEACTGALVARFSAEREFWNAYGPTEGSVAVTLGRCSLEDGDGELPSIGRPLPNTRVYILDEEQQPVAIGEAGELCLGGVAVARGYLNRPELTAQRFLPDAYSPHPGDRIYRTGDLARFRPDGRIEFLGRLDHQVKLRGFRIELGEVEAALLRHPAIGHCVALAREDEPGDRRLVAYVVPRSQAEFSIGGLREFLRVSLPEFMIPSAFVALAALPLTSHGKIDRAALPPPGRTRPALGTPYVGPRSEGERALSSIFAAVLQVDEVGVDDDFFALGGHSLLVGQAAALIAARLRVELPLRELFAHPTVAALAARLEGLRPTQQTGLAIERADRARPLPLSPSQQQVWMTSQLAGASPLYNEPYALTIRGPLVADRLAAALTALIARHEILRTGFEVEDGEPVQKVHPAQPLGLDLQDLSALPPEARAATVHRLHDELTRAPFDLRSPPLLRGVLVRLAEDEHRLLLTLHHAIFDGVSFNQVLLPELVRLYRGGPGQELGALPASPLQYADYAAWARARCTPEALGEQLAYWRRQLAELPALQLPTDSPRPAGGSFRGARHPILLPPELAEGLTALAQREGATLYMALLSAFAVLLHRYSGQDDFAIAGVASTQARPELQGLVGPFVNTVVLRARLAQDPSFVELLGRLRATVVAAMDQTELPFAQLVEALRPERHLGQHPLFQVLFLLDPPGPELPAGWSVSRFTAHNGAAMCDLSLQLDRRPEGLLGFLEYSTDLFAPATIARWAGHLEVLLRDIVARPTAALSELALLPASEQAELARFGGGQREFPVTACLHELFAAQVARTPDAVALTCEQTRLTYRELAQRVDRLAARLQALGVGPDTPVGLCAERSPELVIGILGILRAGGAYVPLDPVYPRERLSFILNDTAAPVLVTHDKVQRALPRAWTGAVVLIDELTDPETATADPLPAATRPEHLAYIIYTSGSTGQPKGVPVTHRNVARLFLATDSYFGFTASDVFCLFHSFAFDFSVWELWGALLYGGRLVVVPYWISRSAEAFYRLLRSEAVTVLNQTPSAFYQLIQAEPLVEPTSEKPLALRLVIFGGEALDLGALRPWFERHGEKSPQLYNMYGITETTVHVTCQPLGSADCDRPGSIIGVPLPDLYARVLDRHLRLAPIGIPGELFVGGAGLARGYLNRPALTAERFIADPYGGPDGRLYRSGDWVRYRADGALEYLGRIDHQIKIRGFRIGTARRRKRGAGHALERGARGGLGEPRSLPRVPVRQAGASPRADSWQGLVATRDPAVAGERPQVARTRHAGERNEAARRRAPQPAAAVPVQESTLRAAPDPHIVCRVPPQEVAGDPADAAVIYRHPDGTVPVPGPLLGSGPDVVGAAAPDAAEAGPGVERYRPARAVPVPDVGAGAPHVRAAGSPQGDQRVAGHGGPRRPHGPVPPIDGAADPGSPDIAGAESP